MKKNPLPRLIPQKVKNVYHYSQSFLSSVRNGFPQRKLKIIGVTGTDGKTTTAHLIYHILKQSGKKVSLISTIHAIIGNKQLDTGFHVTTPDPWDIPQYMKKALQDGSEYMVLEITSHAMDQNRLGGLRFDYGVLTNITSEHLDYHKSMDRYFKAKMKMLRRSNVCVLNRNDSSYTKIVARQKKLRLRHIVTYGLEETSADIMAKNIICSSIDTTFMITYDQTRIFNKVFGKKLTKKKLNEAKVITQLKGEYNVSNILAASAVCLGMGIKLPQIVQALATFKPLAGRFEEILTGEKYRVFVDFAHTPGAFEKVLPLTKGMADKTKGRLIHIFGAAGLRDTKKRPEMGRLSSMYSSVSIITAEDPRTEKVENICKSISEGCIKAGAVFKSFTNDEELPDTTYFILPDRRNAIEYGLKLAKSGDVVLITGKGHEKSMCFGSTEIPWSDQEVVESILRSKR